MKTIFLLILPAILLLHGCKTDGNYYEALDQLPDGALIAVPTGTVADQLVLGRFPDANIAYYNTVLDCTLAVDAGMADAAAYDMPILKNIARRYETLHVLEEVVVPDNYGFAVQSGNQALKATIDKVLSEIISDGTYKQMLDRWLPRRRTRTHAGSAGRFQ